MTRPGLYARFTARLTALASGAGMTVVVLLAGRLVAPQIGDTVNTWVGIACAVMGGWAVGGAAGGRLADRVRPMPALASVLLAAAVACALMWLVNASVGAAWESMGSSPRRIAMHVVATLSPTAALLGATAPLLTQFALRTGRAPGRAAASVWTTLTAGAVAGLILTNYVLAPEFPISTILWIVSGGLAVLAALCGVAAA